MDSLTAKDKEARRFYFKVVTNTYKKADGAYAEGLGYAGKEYVENNTKEFLSNFTGQCKLSSSDFDDWVNIIIGEIGLIAENQDKDVLNKYIKTLESNCSDCTTEDKVILSNFTKQLRIEWDQRGYNK